MSEKKLNVAVAGATGAVGNQMISCLEEADFPVGSTQAIGIFPFRGKNAAI